MLAEYSLEGMLNFFGGILGPERARRYFPFLMTFFLFILFSNWSGIIPGAGHFKAFHPPTSTWSVTAALGILSFLLTQVSGIREKGWSYFGHFFQPIFVLFPLNLIEELVRPLSLSLRLYGNIYGEETVVAVLLSLVPYSFSDSHATARPVVRLYPGPGVHHPGRDLHQPGHGRSPLIGTGWDFPVFRVMPGKKRDDE